MFSGFEFIVITSLLSIITGIWQLSSKEDTISKPICGAFSALWALVALVVFVFCLVRSLQ